MKLHRKIAALGLVCALFVATGCSHLDIARDTSLNGRGLSVDKKNVAHMSGGVSGLYFLPFIPLITGDTDNPDTLMPVFLNDTASLSGAVDMITGRAAELQGTHVLDLGSGGQSTWIFMTPFWWKSYHVTGNAVK